VETDGPQVTSVARYGYHIQPTYILIYFNGPLAPSPAENLANYRIIGPGGRTIKIRRAIYDAATNTVTLVPALRLNLHWTYDLSINGSTASGLTSPEGLLLDGAGTGVPGSNYMTRLAWKNLAGKANQLPTHGLLHSHKAPVTLSVHRGVSEHHAAAIDHALATYVPHRPRERKGR
jgi:hypothetical protein